MIDLPPRQAFKSAMLRSPVWLIPFAILASCATTPVQSQRAAAMLSDDVLLYHWGKTAGTTNDRAMIRPEHIEAEAKKRGLSLARARASYTKQIDIGMSPQDVISAWGYPRDINRTRTAYGTSEQWCYGDLRYYQRLKYVYFEKGKVVTIQD